MYHGAVNRDIPPPPHPLFESRRDPRRFVGAAVSLVLHGALLVLIFRGTVDAILATNAAGNPLLAPGGGGGGGGGGQGPRYISLPPLPPAAATAVAQKPIVPPPEVAPPIPEPTVAEPTPEVVVSQADSVPAAAAAPAGGGTGPGSGGGSGGGTGGGVGPGTGAGSGPGSGGGGAGGTGREPQWTYGTFFFEKTPKELRGLTLQVTFHVGADGRVTRVDTEPEIKDREYARKFEERAMTYRFKPARNAEGVAVPGLSRMTITLPSK